MQSSSTLQSSKPLVEESRRDIHSASRASSSNIFYHKRKVLAEDGLVITTPNSTSIRLEEEEEEDDSSWTLRRPQIGPQGSPGLLSVASSPSALKRSEWEDDEGSLEAKLTSCDHLSYFVDVVRSAVNRTLDALSAVVSEGPALLALVLQERDRFGGS